MAKAVVQPGNCGFHTIIETHQNGEACQISIQSACPAIQKLAAELKEVDPYQEISYRRGGPLTLQTAARHCKHTACPVPVAILKAVEVEAGLALPGDVTIQITTE